MCSKNDNLSETGSRFDQQDFKVNGPSNPPGKTGKRTDVQTMQRLREEKGTLAPGREWLYQRIAGAFLKGSLTLQADTVDEAHGAFCTTECELR